jgi:hypothetical protein
MGTSVMFSDSQGREPCGRVKVELMMDRGMITDGRAGRVRYLLQCAAVAEWGLMTQV